MQFKALRKLVRLKATDFARFTANSGPRLGDFYTFTLVSKAETVTRRSLLHLGIGIRQNEK